MATDLQQPFDVAVVLVTRRLGALETALRSVLAQEHAGRVQILVGVDGDGDRDALARIEAVLPDAIALTVVDPGYSTSKARGGLYAPKEGGSLRAALTLLANARLVAYLGETSRYEPNHLESLKRVIGDRAWAWSRRWFADRASGRTLCRDEWESVGPGQGIYRVSEGGFAAADTLLIDKLRCHPLVTAWAVADAEGRGDDRSLFRGLKSLPNAGTGEPTVTTSVQLARQHPFKLSLFRASGVRLEQFMTVTPELEAAIAHAAGAQVAQREQARSSLEVGGVTFAMRPRDGGTER